jgi:iron complex outermembrane receptor protein
MTKSFRKILMLGASPFVLLVAQALPAAAQSTGTQQLESIETVTVTGIQENVGIMQPIIVPKERSSISQDYINTQMAGQTVFESLNNVPGFNFTNNDPYGNSGGDVRLHGFDGARISFTWDGMPLNDTGNYALYTNQVADSEILSMATVNQGTTDVDSPSAAATGGVIAIRTTKPADQFQAMGDVSYGSFSQERFFGRVDSGAFGPWNTLAFGSLSYDHYDKFKGPGYLQKRQANLSIYQDMGERGWFTVSAHFNSNRNNFYNNVSFIPVPNTTAVVTAAGAAAGTLAVTPNVALDPNTGQYTGFGATNNAQGYGLGFDEAPTCTRPAAVAGTAQIEATSNGGTTAICTSYYNIRINPSDTGNIRAESLIRLTPDITLTIDPSVQYVLANGGGITVLSETDPRLIGTSHTAGVDLNGDGDALDQIQVYSPSNTNTIRYGLNASVLWAINDNNTLQAAYSLDYGLHRQTGQMSFMQANGNPYDVFGGYRDLTHRVLSADGTPIRSRDRRSHAILDQFALAYEGNYLDDTLHVAAGVRVPILERDLNQLCYVQASGSFNQIAPGANFQYCTSEAPSGAVAANGTVTFAGVGANNLFTPPGKEVVKYSKTLPNLGFTFSPWSKEHTFYADFAEGLSAPKTDSLYNGGNNGHCQTATTAGCVYSTFAKVSPETSVNLDLGYRYNSELMTVSLTGYNTQFKNRIVTTFDPDQGISVDHNVGSVNIDGVDFEGDIFPLDNFSVYSSVSYEHSRVAAGPLSTILLNATGTVTVSIAGKELVETPDWTFSQRYQYKWSGFTFGLGGKYVGRRFATDANDARVPSYFTINADLTYDLAPYGWPGSYLKLNGTNLLNKHYFSSVGTSKSCFTPFNPTTSGCTSAPLLVVGSPQTIEITLRTEF